MYPLFDFCFFFNDTATTEIYTLSLHDALPICVAVGVGVGVSVGVGHVPDPASNSQTTSPTNASTFPSSATVSLIVRHPAGNFVSSLAKQPFVGSAPPSNLSFAF